MPNESKYTNDKYMPIRKFVFPAGDCGGEIRINIPLVATKSDVELMVAALSAIAEKWKDTE